MNTIATYTHQPWNKGKLVCQKAPLRFRDTWAIRVRLQLAEKCPGNGGTDGSLTIYSDCRC